MINLRILGAWALVVVFGLDQASKFAVVHGLATPEPGSTYLLPILDLVLRWNNGISFSLFPQDTAFGVFALLGFTIVAVGLLGAWLWRARTAFVALGLGAIIGGALGNASDRFAYGAVVDFLDLHLGAHHFFVFNVADAGISLGVGLLILDSLLGAPATEAAGPPRV